MLELRFGRRASRLDRAALLRRLEKIESDPVDDEEEFDRANLTRVLLNLVEVNQETEYGLCRAVASHLLGPGHERDGLSR